MKFNKKDLVSIRDLTKEEIEFILKQAQSFKEINERAIKKVPTLRGKTVVTCFYEPSTRTRLSFEVAAKRLSADTLNFSASTSSVKKGETFLDTLKNIEALKSDVVIIRHPASGACKFASKVLKASVVNAGDGINEHPTQALLDAYTIIEKKGQIKGLNIIIAVDILHSRVARSNIFLLTKLGANVKVYAPPMMMPRDIEETGVKIVKNFREEIKVADVVMMLRVQLERQNKALFPSIREYAKFFGFKKEYLENLKDDAIIMHPGPMNRGVEISSEVADSDKSVILEQVENGIAVRMAILYLLIGRGGEN